MWRTAAAIGIAVAFFLSVLPASRALAKRAAPPQVQPVIVDDVEYSAQSELVLADGKPVGSIANLVATDLKSRKTLWKVPVYEVRFDRTKETDVQDVRIASIRPDEANLIIQNDRKQEFLLDTKTRTVRGLIR